MKKENMIRKGAAFILMFFLTLSVSMITEYPVSAATSIRTTKIQSTVKGSSTDAVSITWKKDSRAKGYVIYRKSSSDKKYTRIKTVGSSVSYYADRGLKSGTIYKYNVLAYRTEKGKKIYSSFSPVTVATRPVKTSKVKIKAVSSSRVNVYWNKVQNADGYRVYRKADGGSWKIVKDLSAGTLSYADKTADPGTEYVYTSRPYKLAAKVKYLGAATVSNKVTTDPSSSSNTKFGATQKEVMKKILYAVETGGQVYGNQKYGDFTEAFTNSSTEYAITIGAGQWYATEAQRLLKLIHSTMGEATYKKYDPKGYVWNDVQNANWSSYKLKKTTNRARIIVKLISSPVGIKCQDKLMYEQIEEFETEIRKLGVTDHKAVGMFINIRHQGGYGAVTRVLAKTSKPYTLKNIYKALSTDTGGQVGTYRTRQAKVYSWLNTYM